MHIRKFERQYFYVLIGLLLLATACTIQTKSKESAFFKQARIEPSAEVNTCMRMFYVNKAPVTFQAGEIIDVDIELDRECSPLLVDDEEVFFFVSSPEKDEWISLKNKLPIVALKATIDPILDLDIIPASTGGVPDLGNITVTTTVRMLFKGVQLDEKGNHGKQVVAFMDLQVEP